MFAIPPQYAINERMIPPLEDENGASGGRDYTNRKRQNTAAEPIGATIRRILFIRFQCAINIISICCDPAPHAFNAL